MEAGRRPSPAPSNPESDEKQRKRGQYENKKNNLLRFQSNHPPPAPDQNDARDYGNPAGIKSLRWVHPDFGEFGFSKAECR